MAEPLRDAQRGNDSRQNEGRMDQPRTDTNQAQMGTERPRTNIEQPVTSDIAPDQARNVGVNSQQEQQNLGMPSRQERMVRQDEPSQGGQKQDGLTLVERKENETAEKPAPLFNETQLQGFRAEWSQVQTGFVDEPRRAVQDADKLVTSLLRQLTEGFSAERANLEKQWDKGDRVSTEDLRLALQRYRSFFDRLLKI